MLGLLLEVCEGSGVSAQVEASAVPLIPQALAYLAQGCIPGGTLRNLESYGHKLDVSHEATRNLLCDPQTSGGLLIAVEPGCADKLESLLIEAGIEPCRIGQLTSDNGGLPVRVVGAINL